MKRLQLTGTALALVLPGMALADGHTTYVIHPDEGFIGVGCMIDFETTIEGAPLEEIMQIAEERGANAFVFWPEKEYGALVIGPYPESCEAEADRDWDLYIATETIEFYQQADHGIDGCGVSLGAPLSNLSEQGMFVAARNVDATAFVYDASTGEGRVVQGDLPADCQPAADPDWTLYINQRG